MIILAANILIGFLNAHDPNHAASKVLIERRFLDGFGASVLTVAEALVYPTRDQREDAALTSFARIGLQVISLLATDATRLARVRDLYGLRMPDAAALHAALSTASELATFDESLRAAAGRAGVAVVDSSASG